MLTPVYIRSTPLDTTDLRGYLRGTNYGSAGYYFLHGYEWIWMDVNTFGMGNTWIVCWINAGIRHTAYFCVSCCVVVRAACMDGTGTPWTSEYGMDITSIWDL